MPARQSRKRSPSQRLTWPGLSQPRYRSNVITGFPAQALIDTSQDADLVVVGSRGTGGFATLMLGSVASQVAHHAACPVVIVHTGK